MKRFVIHLPRHQLLGAPERTSGFYGTLRKDLTAAGAEVRYRERTSLRAAVGYEAEAFHFVHQGLVSAPNVLNTGLSYLPEFWYADPKGVFGFSSLYDEVFEPEHIPEARAEKFASWLRQRTLQRRLSKHAQPMRAQSFEPGGIAVFLQGPSLPVTRAAYVEERDMVRAIVAARGDRPVWIKRHPRNPDPETWDAIAPLVEATEGVTLVDAHVHDLLAAAALCVSVSSSVAVEAMLHDVPSLTFGRVDFHHCTQTVTSLTDVPYAIEAALNTRWPFAPFLFWFFRHHCLDMRADKWTQKLNTRLGDYRLRRLGRK